MPNTNPLFRNLSLDPAEVIAVNGAYDLACQTLQNIGQLEADREIIAGRILRGSGTLTNYASAHPWIDRVRLSATSHLKRPGQCSLMGL
jgi:hypothetical protein